MDRSHGVAEPFAARWMVANRRSEKRDLGASSARRRTAIADDVAGGSSRPKGGAGAFGTCGVSSLHRRIYSARIGDVGGLGSTGQACFGARRRSLELE